MCNLSLISLNLSALSFFFLIFNLMKLNRVEKTIMHLTEYASSTLYPTTLGFVTKHLFFDLQLRFHGL